MKSNWLTYYFTSLGPEGSVPHSDPEKATYSTKSSHSTSVRFTLILAYSAFVSQMVFKFRLLKYNLLTYTMFPSCSKHLFLLDLIISKEENKLNCSLCHFPHSVTTSSLWDPQIYLNIWKGNKLFVSTEQTMGILL